MNEPRLKCDASLPVFTEVERTTSSVPHVWPQWKLLPGGLLRGEANHVGPGFITTKGVPWTVSIRVCELPLQRKPARNRTLKTFAVNSQGCLVLEGKGGAATGAGDGDDGEGSFAAKGGGRRKRRARGLSTATQ